MMSFARLSVFCVALLVTFTDAARIKTKARDDVPTPAPADAPPALAPADASASSAPSDAPSDGNSVPSDAPANGSPESFVDLAAADFLPIDYSAVDGLFPKDDPFANIKKDYNATLFDVAYLIKAFFVSLNETNYIEKVKGLTRNVIEAQVVKDADAKLRGDAVKVFNDLRELLEVWEKEEVEEAKHFHIL